MSVSDAQQLNQLFYGSYSKDPIKSELSAADTYQFSDQGSQYPTYIAFNGDTNNLANQWVDFAHDSSLIGIPLSITSGTTGAFTASTQLCWQAPGPLALVNYCTLNTRGGSIVQETNSAGYMTSGFRKILSTGLEFLSDSAQEDGLALDSSASLTGASGAYSNANYVAAPTGSNVGVALRVAMFNNDMSFNGSGAITGVAWVKIRDVLDFWNNLGSSEYGFSFNDFRIYLSTQAGMPNPLLVINPGANSNAGSPVINVVGGNSCIFQYRRLTPTADNAIAIQEKIEKMRRGDIRPRRLYYSQNKAMQPQLTNTTQTVINANLTNGVSRPLRLFFHMFPTGGLTSNTTYPWTNPIANGLTLSQVQIFKGTEPVYKFPLAQNVPGGLPNYRQLWHAAVDGSPGNGVAYDSKGINLGWSQWYNVQRWHIFQLARPGSTEGQEGTSLALSIQASVNNGVAPSAYTVASFCEVDSCVEFDWSSGTCVATPVY